MTEARWLSPVDIPRDGTPINVLFRDYHTRSHRAKSPVVLRVEALMLGECDSDDGTVVVDWYCAGTTWDCPFDAAANLDPNIVGWSPIPSIPGSP